MQKIGIGYDVHKIEKDKQLTIGGINIPYEINGTKYGVTAHSDGDVLTHAIIDALLGAMGLGDIGEHFPDTSSKYKNINSQILLKEVNNMLQQQSYKIINIDATVIAQAPKISPYKIQMRKTLATTLNIQISQINIKATTEEGLGFTGQNQGIAANAVCLINN